MHVAEASWLRHELPLAEAFRISRGASEVATVFAVTVEDEAGHRGVGAAAPSRYHGEPPSATADALPGVCDAIRGLPVHALERARRGMDEAAPEAPAARSAASGALHDLAARRADLSLRALLGLGGLDAPPTSVTVSAGAPDAMAERAAERVDEGFGTLKLKLGVDDAARERRALRAVRAACPDAVLRVDANGGWSAEGALERLDALADADVALLEQPVPSDDLAGLERVADAAAMPVYADEPVAAQSDVPRVAPHCDGVVLKLAKHGGVRPTLDALATARSHGLGVMPGCRVASSAAIAPAVHLAPLADHVDLDGAVLLDEDPYVGVPLDGDRFRLDAVARGTGIEAVGGSGVRDQV